MSSTLKITPTTLAKVGSIQIQPVKDSIQATVKTQTTKSTSPSAAGVLPASESVVPVTCFIANSGELEKLSSVTLTSIVQNMVSDSNFVVAPMNGKSNKVLPTYAATNNVAKPFPPAIFAKKFQPYEQLTGISHDRPEIVMLVPFKPAFLDGVNNPRNSSIKSFNDAGIHSYMTDAGLFLDTRWQLNNVLTTDWVQLLKDLYNKNDSVRSQGTNALAAFEKQLNDLNTISSFLLGIVQRVETLRNQLDLRDDVYKLDPDDYVYKTTGNVTQTGADALKSYLASLIGIYVPKQYDLVDVLIRFGYPEEQSRSLFSSTKLWLQSLLEYKNVLTNHSLEFLDIATTPQKNDVNATKITKNDVKLFDITRSDPPGLPALPEFILTQPSGLTSLASTVQKAFSLIYEQGSHFASQEVRLAAIANAFSKELKYSVGLGKQDVQQVLSEFYRFNVDNQTGANVGVFDSVVGDIRDNTTDVAVTRTNSLADLGQLIPSSDVAVLTFESKYLEQDNSFLTPGSAYYVDSVFTSGTPDVSRLKTLSDSLKTSYEKFSVIVNGMNVLTPIEYDLYRSAKSIDDVLSEPAQLMRDLTSRFVDAGGVTKPLLKNDRLSSLYSLAMTDSKIKSLLFVYTMNRVSRAYARKITSQNASLQSDNTPMITAVMDQLINAMTSGLKETSTTTAVTVQQKLSSQADSVELGIDSILTALKQGSIVQRVIEDVLTKSLDAFQKSGFVNGRTRYGGRLDTVVMMVAFDLVLSLIAKYNNQTMVGRSSSSDSKISFVVVKTNLNHKNSVNSLVTKIEKELALTYQATFCFLSVLKRLSDSIDGVVNYVQSPQATDVFSKLSSLIPQNTLGMLLSEEQIAMLASTVNDVTSRYKNIAAPSTDISDGSDGNFDSDPLIKVLDDSELSVSLRSALYGMLVADEFTGTRAYNKRILTIGVPQGFSKKLRNSVSLSKRSRTSFANKQNDIVQVSVYKVDVLNQDVIYKPVKFLFELSRFPVRDQKYIKTVSDFPSMDEIVSSVPTRDFQQGFEQGTDAIAYWNTGGTTEQGSSSALSSESYSFLTLQQKSDIVRNHVVSYLVEAYVKLMTGMSIAEHRYGFIGQTPTVTMNKDLIRSIIAGKIQRSSDFSSSTQPLVKAQNGINDQPSTVSRGSPVGGVLFATTSRSSEPMTNTANGHVTLQQPKTSNASGISGNISAGAQFQAIQDSQQTKTRDQQRRPSNIEDDLLKLSYRQVAKTVQILSTTSQLTKATTTWSDALSFAKNVVQPKQFDRVFNVIVDPDEFEIDYDKTIQTEYGKKALEQLISAGDIVASNVSNVDRRSQTTSKLRSSTSGNGRMNSDPNVNSFRFRDRDRNESDMMFEKYFVTIDTFGEET